MLIASHPAEPLRRRYPTWAGVLLAVVALKVALLLLDPHARFFFGDSAAYLHAATHRWGLPDRSSSYPFFIWLTVLPTHQLGTLIGLQTLFGVAVSMLSYWMLRQALGVRPFLASAAAVALALDPMQLYYERSVMAECLGTFCLMLMSGCLVAYFRRAQALWLVPATGFGLAAVSLRMNLLPVVLVVSSSAPLLWLFARGATGPRLGTAARHLLLAAALTFAAHSAYKIAYGLAYGIPPAYLAHEGYFKLGWLAPLVEPEHLTTVCLPADWLAEIPVDYRDHRSRDWQMWTPEGLIPRFREHAGERAPQLAEAISQRVLRERPLDVLRLGWLTLLDHFDPVYAKERMENDLGSQPPPAEFVEIWRRELNYDASDWRHRDGIVYRWFETNRTTLTAALLISAPLGLLMLWLAWRQRSPVVALLASLLFGLAVSHVIFSHMLVYRYLHPLAPPLLTLIALGIDRLIDRRGHDQWAQSRMALT